MSPIDSHTELIRTADHACCVLGGESVLIHLETGKYFSLDAPATRIWSLLERRHSVGELVTRLVAEFDVPPEQCQRDTLAFLEQLRHWRLLEVV